MLLPSQAFHDVDLYRWWMYQGLVEGHWPVLDDPSVYPAGAVLPMLLAAVGGVTNPGYALAWSAMVTALDAVAVAALLRRPGGVAAALWWLAFMVLLGPVALGRLDGVVAPLTLLALLAAVGPPARPRLAATLLTVGAWVKVAPGALVLPLAAAARRPLRDVVAPAAAVCAVVVAAVVAGGGAPRLLGFLSTQGDRGLQVESVTASMLGALHRSGAIRLNDELVTYEVVGPGTTAAVRVLDVLLPVAVAAVAGLLVLARRRGTAVDALLPGALTLVAVLVVANKVGSPQFLTWFAAPVAVALATRAAAVRSAVPVLLLVVAGLTQAVFPWGYLQLLRGDTVLVLVLEARNALLVAVLVLAVVRLVRIVRGRAEVVTTGTAGTSTASGLPSPR